MHPLMFLFTALVISMVVVPLMRHAAPRLGLMDQPGEDRKVHEVPVARVGGWGIVLGGLAPVVAWLPMSPLIQSYVFGALLLLAFGAVDDRYNIGHYSKLLGQLLAVVPVVYLGDLWVHRIPFMGAETLPAAIGKPFTVFAMVGVINAVNHSDGLDGLASGETLLSLVSIGFITYLYADGLQSPELGAAMLTLLLVMATVGGVLGFLRHNTHPARVFMGDTGSQFLGFTVGFLAVLLTQRANPALSPALPLLILGLPVMDILTVLFLRAKNGMHWLRGSRNHLHHRLLDRGFSHPRCVVIIYAIQTLFVVAAVVLPYAADGVICAIYVGVGAFVFTLLTIAERRGWRAERSPALARVTAHIPGGEGTAEGFGRAAVRFLALAVPGYLLYCTVGIADVPQDFGVLSAVLLLGLLLDRVLGPAAGSWMHRAIVYATAIFIIYLSGDVASRSLGSPLEIAFFVLLTLAVVVAVRKSSAEEFQTTTTDYLAALVIGATVLLSFSAESPLGFGAGLLKAMAVLYGCELVLNRQHHRLSALTLVCLVALGIFGYRGLVSGELLAGADPLLPVAW